ncbi:hypothetical protein BC351_10405 [Paenibacillus ferrarius]|uniref:Uncharacterized protein n=1 Tax=Paenibacillus ferrarius TaxID=1469647 RepID=A0A1V4H8R2_9BACL|nr:hypothetical protein [Paenibacillus ferrarius]OPH47594.1 hypothetical protein BC351_10405 [Paenibacillus ferrarius]
MTPFQLKQKTAWDSKVKQIIISGKDLVSVPPFGFYTKAEFHETVQGWVTEGYVIVSFTHCRDTFYTQLKDLPSYIGSSYEIVKTKPVDEAAEHYCFGMAMQQM